MTTSRIGTEWRALKRGQPGRRFQNRYEQSRRKRAGVTLTWRVVRLVFAFLAIAVGVILMFIPGPAILFFLIAGSFLATESLAIARLLDVLEVKLRALWQWIKRRWRALPPVGKGIVALLLVTVTSASCYVAWRVTFG